LLILIKSSESFKLKNSLAEKLMNHKVSILIKIYLVLLIMFGTINLYAQQNNSQKAKNDTIPGWHKEIRISPKAFVMQTIGKTDVSIAYSKPGVKGRKIWGGLVPYDKVWRAGANEATKITLSSDVLINGKKLSKGSYSFFVVPTEKDWTIIFNKVADQWGAFEYNQAEDILRLKVNPETNDFHEWLEYNFSDMKVDTKNLQANSAAVNLMWDKIKISFTVQVL
jgi:Protein of unknown function (DUF2911)